MTAGRYKEDWLWSADPDQYVAHEMGEAIFVYSLASGTTHILNLVSLAMLEFLAEKPKTVAALAEEFPAYLKVPREECPTGVARRIFDELDDVGLVFRVTP